MVFAYFLAMSPRKCFRKILFMSGLVFCCLVLSVLGFGLSTSFVLSLFSLSFSFERQSSGLTGHHTPPRTCCCFSFFLSPPLCLVRLFWPCVLFVLGFLRGAILGPRAFFGFSRDSSEAFFLDARRQRRVLVFWSVVFPVLRLRTFLVGLAPGRRKAGPRVVSPAPPARVRVGGRMPFSGGGTKTPSCLVKFLFFASSVRFWPQEAQEPVCLLGRLLRRPKALTRTFFPRSLSLSFSVSLGLFLFGLRGPRHVGPASRENM